jgi:excisionase family DNA binding protein
MTADTEQRLLVPILDACDQLGGISRPTLYRLVNDRELDLVKIGTRSFITSESLRDFVGRKLRESTAEGEAGGDGAA